MKLVDLINNISTDVNNKKYYNNIVESDTARAISDSTTNLTSILLKENKKVDVTKLTNSKYSIKKKYLYKFINSLRKYVNDSNNLDVNKVIPREIRNNSRNNISKYQILLKYKYLINSRYRYLKYDPTDDVLFCVLSSGETVTFEEPSELINIKVKDTRNNTYLIESINLNDDGIYEFALSNVRIN